MGLQRLLHSLVRWRVGWSWLLLGGLWPLALAGCAVLGTYIFTSTWPVCRDSGKRPLQNLPLDRRAIRRAMLY